MKKLFTTYFFTIFLLLFALSFQTYYNFHPFNSTTVKNHTAYISSDHFKGRFPGTFENQEIAVFIKDQFKINGLVPLENNYFQKFNVNCPTKIKGHPYLNIMDQNGKIIKEFRYSEDFKEDMLNIKKNKTNFSKNNSEIIYNNYIKIKQDKSTFLFYVPGNDTLDFRSSFFESAPFDLYVMISKNTFNDLKDYLDSGYSVNYFTPYKIEEKIISNVLAVIPGKNPTLPPIVISSHFDHVGTDLAGNIYNGALDNASGTSFVLEMSKYMTSLQKPERNIIFAAFNAEEFGCLGSTEFVKRYNPLLKGSKVFNFDMIGGTNSTPLCIMGGKNDTSKTPFIHSISLTCSQEKIFFNYLFTDSSDHQSFRKENISAITFCDNDLSKIHTSNDTSEFINISSIDRCFKAVSRQIIKEAYNGNPLLVYYEEILFFSLSGLLLLILLVRFFKKN